VFSGGGGELSGPTSFRLNVEGKCGAKLGGLYTWDGRLVVAKSVYSHLVFGFYFYGQNGVSPLVCYQRFMKASLSFIYPIPYYNHSLFFCVFLLIMFFFPDS